MAKKIDPTAPPDLSNHKPSGIVTFDATELADMDPAERETALYMNNLAAEGIDPTLNQDEIAAIRAQRAASQQQTTALIAAQPEPTKPAAEKPNEGQAADVVPTDVVPNQQQATPAAAPPPAEQTSGPELDLLPVEDITAMEAQRKELRTKERDLQKQWVDGEIDQDAYDQSLTAIQEQIDGIANRIGAASATAHLNQLTIQRHQQATINAIRARGAEIGIDYSDAKTGKSFDNAMDLLEADPDNAKLTFAELAERAHAMVAAMNNKVAAPPAPAPAGAKPRTPPPIPRTLGNVPSAEIPNQGSQAQDLGTALFSGKSAAEQEEAWDKLTEAQKRQILGSYA